MLAIDLRGYVSPGRDGARAIAVPSCARMERERHTVTAAPPDESPESPPRREDEEPSELAPRNLLPAAVGSAAATAILSRVGLLGTVLGAALVPVIIALVRELGRRPVIRLSEARRGRSAVRPDGAPRPARPAPPGPRRLASGLRHVRWRVVLATAAAAFALTVAAFTVADLLAGDSVVSGRDRTFFGGGGGSSPAVEPPAGATAPTTTAPTRTAPAEAGPTTAPPIETTPTTPTEPAPTEPAPTTTVPTTTAPTATDPAPAAPAPTAPAPSVGTAPATTAPAPPASAAP